MLPAEPSSRVTKSHMVAYEVNRQKDVPLNEPSRGKTNNVVSGQVRHKPTCTSTEKSQKLEISDLNRRGILLSV